MRATSFVRGCVLVSIFVLVTGRAALLAGTPEQIKRGRALFERVWEPQTPIRQGDGLGPMFNERSCIACHFLGGIGGAGPNEHNVELLTPAVPANADEVIPLFKRLEQLHFGFRTGVTVTLHRYSLDVRYADFRADLLGLKVPDYPGVDPDRFLKDALHRQGNGPVKKIITNTGDKLLLSYRSTTPMFGAGMIDLVPMTLLRKIAAEQPDEDRNVSGRVVGRFGWRGQVNSLKDFVLGACAVELGLEVPGHSQAFNPLDPPAPLKPGAQPPPVDPKLYDMTPQECDDLIAYIGSLPRPEQVMPTDINQRGLVSHGETLFDSIGCVICHEPKLGPIDGLYSDLLLHDMGAKLEDPSPAMTSIISSSAYYGAAQISGLLASENRREWKTPPLWGLRDSAPYLHDGRAATVEEAILYHDGEAAGSVARYKGLPAFERQRVLLFLSTLAGPDPARLGKPSNPKRTPPVRAPRVALAR
jgi:CxxC motif-containing protein (DUF1111 family)